MNDQDLTETCAALLDGVVCLILSSKLDSPLQNRFIDDSWKKSSVALAKIIKYLKAETTTETVKPPSAH